MTKLDILNKLDEIIAKGASANKGAWGHASNLHTQMAPFNNFKSSALNFISNLLGADSIYYQQFNQTVRTTNVSYVSGGMGILRALREDIEQDLLLKYKDIVSAEIFSDFLEMAKHLLEQGYKDPSAVMIGSVLEEHLRQLCQRNGIETTFDKDGRQIPKKAEVMNSDLKKDGIYNLLEQKQITAWLDLRNSAAHGNYDQYSADQVKLMYLGVSNFLTK